MRRLLILVCILTFSLVQAQDRPKVGIVLSGGGAKGFAHIGVLEILDSLGIPVDAIGGTSMGSIVGGLYAIGHSPQDLARISTTTEWSFITDPRPERKYLAPYEKNTYERYLLTLDINKDGIRIPGGLNPGERIINLLTRHTVGFHNPLDYTSDLPIPFVCVSTELNTGREVVMKDGILALSLRSSMSIPSLFSPFWYEGRYVIDGGTVNNFPADHVRALGADIVIGVDVQTTFSDTISDPTFLKVLEKTSMYMNALSTSQRESLCDLIIHPDMTGFGVTSFDAVEEIIESGRKAARANMAQLIAIREQIGGYHDKEIEPYLAPDRIIVDEIRIKGLVKTSRRNVLGNLGFNVGDTLSFDQIEEGMLRLHGTNLFTLANYLTYMHENETVLEIRIIEKPSNSRLRVGIRYDSDFESAALLNFTSRNRLFSGSYFSADLAIGPAPRLNVQYIWDHGALPGLGTDVRLWNYNSRWELLNSSLGRLKHTDLRWRLFGTSSFGKSTSVKLGGSYHTYGVSSDVSSTDDFIDLLDPENEWVDVFLELQYDDRDQQTFSKRGSALLLEVYAVEGIGRGDNDYPVITSLRWQGNLSLTKRWVLRPTIYGLYSTSQAPGPYASNLGGVGLNYINQSVPFYGYRHATHHFGYPNGESTEFVNGRYVGMIRWDLQYEIFTDNFVTVGVNAAGVTDDITNPFAVQNSAILSGFKVEYGLNTIIGPIKASVQRSFEWDNWFGYVSIGYWF